MPVSPTDRLAEDYLRRLDRAAAPLPETRRRELVDAVVEHLAQARRDGEPDDEAALRGVLDRLGEPEEIVAAAVEQEPGAAARPSRRPRLLVEGLAVAFLTVGAFLPLIGWAVGVALAWASRVWTWREKLLATFVVPGGPFTVLALLALVGGQTCTSTSTATTAGGVPSTEMACTGWALPPLLGLLLVVAVVVAPLVVAGVLLGRARRRVGPRLD